jgi:NAD+ kinase
LKQGDHIKVTASKYPFPTVCADKQSTDWFHAISRTLKWNERERQKSFVMVEEGPAKVPSLKRVSNPPTGLDGIDGKKSSLDEEDEEDEDVEEEKFDIDDSSNPSSTTNSAAPSTQHTPASSRVQSKGNLSMTTMDYASSESSVMTNKDSNSEIDLEINGARDNIHSPNSLLHTSKPQIPNNRDFDLMLTPRPTETAHPQSPPQNRHNHHVHHVHHAHHAQHLQAPSSRFAPIGVLDHVPGIARGRQNHHHQPVHRSSRSVGFPTRNRAFACWGQDESDSNTDSEI